ncbi:hypothetical protein DIPPA_23929 [Diplonema papillatum]|nr:hypothetical protein DIPPA_23929 [Diplonema papillatum]
MAQLDVHHSPPKSDASSLPLDERYTDYGTRTNICDVILGVQKRDEWMCPLCKNMGDGEGGYPMPHSEKEEHERSRCPVKKVPCPSCNADVKVTAKLEHMKHCTGVAVDCNRCGAKVRQCYEANHLAKCVPFGETGSLHLRLDSQCAVTSLMPGGVAAQGGMRVGDVPCRVSNPTGVVPVATRDDFMKAVGPRSAVFKGTTITIWVLRSAELIQDLRSCGGDRGSSSAAIRSMIGNFTHGMIPINVTLGSETVAARENRRKKLTRLQTVFPSIDLQLVDDFMTDPVKCKEVVLDAFIAADDDGEGALGPQEMMRVMRRLAGAIGIEPPSIADCFSAFKEIDVGLHGLLTFDEFFPSLRSMIMEVVWAEGTLALCSKCGFRTRARYIERHTQYCTGDLFPRGSFHFDVTPSNPLTIHSLGPAAQVTGLQEGDILLRFNGVAVNTRSELGRLASPMKGVVAGSQVELEIRRRGTNACEVLQHTMFPLAEDLVGEATQCLTQHLKKSRVSPGTVFMLCQEARVFRDCIRQDFELADEQGNGYVDRSAVNRLFMIINAHLYLPTPSDPQAAAIFDKIDASSDGTVSLEEIFPIIRIYYITELEQADPYAHLSGLR